MHKFALLISRHSRHLCVLVMMVPCTTVAMHQITSAVPEYTWVEPQANELASQREAVIAAMAGLDKVLQRTPDGQQWREYFLWDTLVQAMRPEVDEDREKQDNSLLALQGVYNRFADDHAGLERHEVQNLRAAIRSRILQLNALPTSRSRAEAQARIKRLEQLSIDNSRDGASQSEYAEHVRWLEDRLQPIPRTKLAAASSNLTVNISAGFMKAATMSHVSDPTDVNECIVGTRVIGNGVTTGAGWLEPVFCADGARLAAKFQGSLASDTVGYSGPVRVFSDGQTQLEGTALLELDGKGLRRISSTVDASADSYTKGISTKFNGLLDRVVKRIATKKIAESKSQANWESSYKARQSFGKRFERDVEKQVNDGDASFQKFLGLPLKRRDLFPADWQWKTDASSLHTSIAFDGRSRPGAIVQPPLVDSPSAIQVSVHQSFVDNVMEGYLAGRLQTASKLVQQSGAPTVEGPSDVAVRLDFFHPVQCTFDNNEVTIIFFGEQFVAGGNEYPAARISITYRLATSEQGWILERVSSPQVQPPASYSRRSRFGATGSALAEILEPILNDELPQRLPITIPALESDAPDAVKNLQLVSAFANDGWLYLAFDSPNK